MKKLIIALVLVSCSCLCFAANAEVKILSLETSEHAWVESTSTSAEFLTPEVTSLQRFAFLYSCAEWATDVCDYYGIDVSTPSGLAVWTTLYVGCEMAPSGGEQ